MKTKVPAWVSIMIVAIVFVIVGVVFWWYTGGKSEYESRHPSAETLAWRKELAQSETFKGAPFSMPKTAPPTKLEFSAQTINIHIVDGKKLTDLGRLYYEKGVKYRDEMKSPGGSHITIMRFDKRSILDINDTDKTYTEGFGGIARMGAGDDYVIDTAILRKAPDYKHMGTERIDGKLCDKYIQGDPGSAVTIWVSRKIPGLCLKRVYQTERISTLLARPINARMKNGPDIPVSIELKNVRLDHQPDSLFEPPKGYKQVAIDYSGGLMVPNGALKMPTKRK